MSRGHKFACDHFHLLITLLCRLLHFSKYEMAVETRSSSVRLKEGNEQGFKLHAQNVYTLCHHYHHIRPIACGLSRKSIADPPKWFSESWWRSLLIILGHGTMQQRLLFHFGTIWFEIVLQTSKPHHDISSKDVIFDWLMIATHKWQTRKT